MLVAINRPEYFRFDKLLDFVYIEQVPMAGS